MDKPYISISSSDSKILKDYRENMCKRCSFLFFRISFTSKIGEMFFLELILNKIDLFELNYDEKYDIWNFLLKI